MKFLFPIDGDCLNSRDGRKTELGLTVPVRVSAPADHEILIGGTPASFADGVYTAEVSLVGYRHTILAEDRTAGETERITVLTLPRAEGYYRLSSDDNIIFLQDITAHADEYTSIFDNPYLAIYKKAHDLYGAKAHLNLFYAFEPTARFSDASRTYFDLSMMTDKFKDEFKANSDWLKLAFHAHAEFPDRPYQHATAEKITEDCTRVCREIIRFAGEECLSDSTTVHWGEANRECVRALRAMGMRSLTGYFERLPDGTPLVAYYTDGELLDHIGARDFYLDTAEDMLFGRIDLVLNDSTYEYIMSEIAKVVADPYRSGFVSVMIHEQYFHKDYRRYLADFEARVLDTCRYLADHGYVGAHITETVEEPHFRFGARLG